MHQRLVRGGECFAGPPTTPQKEPEIRQESSEFRISFGPVLLLSTIPDGFLNKKQRILVASEFVERHRQPVEGLRQAWVTVPIAFIECPTEPDCFLTAR